MTVALITAVYPSTYDTVWPLPPQDIDVDAVVVTDDPDFCAAGWRTHYLGRPGFHPNQAAKLPKCCPWLFTEARASVWVDASFRILSRSFVSAHVAWADPFALFAHPGRDCIYEEADVSRAMPKYRGQAIREQIAYYREQGHPRHYGLWEAGVMAMRHTPAVMALGQVWMNHIETFSFQDQLSLPFLLRQMGMEPQAFPVELRRLAENRPSVHHGHVMPLVPILPTGGAVLHG